jgi:Ino eighty subunit 1
MAESEYPPEPIPPVGYLSRKALPIKRNDAEILTREDVQYDLLESIFADETAVFTSQTPGPSTKITFRELYVNALYHSNKCSKVLKEKILETPAFGVELGKISLLTNVGRINTTMAFFPEMKTALRTYHPVPSLQKTDGNAQDAPRIKNCLKAALLPSEFKSLPPSTPEEVLDRRKAGQCPPTSIVNLIFVLSNHAAPLSTLHFDGNLNFLDLFLPKPLDSKDRGRAFLWIIYHYLESDASPNPFDIPHSRQVPGKAPFIRPLTHAEMNRENVDTVDEIEWGKRMSAQRNFFLQKLVTVIENEKKSKPAAPHFVPAVSNSPSSRTRSGKKHSDSRDDGPFMYYVPGEELSPPPHEENHVPRLSSYISRASPSSLPSTISPDPVGEVERYPMLSIPTPILANTYLPQRAKGGQSLLQQAWRSVMASDPLLDSDEEDGDDDGELRVDYEHRLSLISAIRGRPPTPERPPRIIEPNFTPPQARTTFTRWQPVQSWD